MQTRELLENIAYENGLDYVETVKGGGNGYPRDIRGAIIGFGTFDEAKGIVEKNEGLKLVTLHKRDGWQMYERENYEPYQPLHIRASDYGDDYQEFEVSDRRFFFKNEVKPFLEDIDSFDELKKFVRCKEKIYEKLDDIDDGQLVITRCGSYYDTIDRELMEWSNDTHTYVIGVMGK